MDKSKKENPLLAEDIKKYLSGESDNKHKVERKLLSDAFALESLEGFEAMRTDEVSETRVMLELQQKLNTRIQKKQENRFWTLRSIGVAASVFILLGVGMYYLNVAKPDTPGLTINTKPKVNTTQESPSNIPLAKNENSIESTPKSTIAKVEKSRKQNVDSESEVIEDKAKERTNAYQETSDLVKLEESQIIVQSPSSNVHPNKSINKRLSETGARFEGEIMDSYNHPVIGATVLINKKRQRGESSIDGSFEILDTEIGDTLTIRSPGYKEKKVVVADYTHKTIKLEDEHTEGSIALARKKDIKLETDISSKIIEPKPTMGWKSFDEMLVSAARQTGAVSSINFDKPIHVEVVIETSGKASKAVVNGGDLDDNESQEIAETIKKNTRWFPAQKKGKKIRKSVSREIQVK
ncbi:MAG: hypothetical protein ACRCVT_02845 [Leadbetterella sp.]